MFTQQEVFFLYLSGYLRPHLANAVYFSLVAWNVKRGNRPWPAFATVTSTSPLPLHRVSFLLGENRASTWLVWVCGVEYLGRSRLSLFLLTDHHEKVTKTYVNNIPPADAP